MSKPNNLGFYSWEAAAVLEMSTTQFTLAVAAGKMPRPSHYDDSGEPRWEGGVIGRAANKHLGPVGLDDLADSLARVENSVRGK